MLKIYNTISRKKEEFKPITQGNVGIYVCGPTVYGPPHVGHARSYTNFDIVVRYLKFLGYKVKYIQNITDVGHLVGDSDDGQDKILKQALLEKIDPYEIAYKYETIYFDCMDKLNILRPSISSRATGFIPEMIDMVQELVNKGYAYVTKEGNVYYSVEKFKAYGQLSNRDVKNALSGERIEVSDDKKRPEDFALWKKAEPEHIMKWNSPWSVGYPGWHVECSAMSRKFLGKTFDIHGGGLDNVFPHHECEFAQSEAVNDAKFVNFFMHNNLITVNGTKMGKSLGNYITLPDLFKKFNPQAVRYFILQFHYRSPIDFNTDAIDSAQTQFGKIAKTINLLREKTANTTEPKSAEIKKIYNNIIEAMNEDFNTPVALSELLALTKEINKNINNLVVLAEINYVITSIAENVLGFKFNSVENKEDEIPSEVIKLAEARLEARTNKNWAESDRLRDELAKLGYAVKDNKDGYELTKN